jgi:hypothetical protein
VKARRLLGYALAAAVTLLPQAVSAQQRGLQALDFILQQADREIQRQNQLNFENQQRMELHRLEQLYVQSWHACHANNLSACNQALSHPSLNPNDHQILSAKRAAIIEAQRVASEQERRERLEAQRAEQRRQREHEQQAEHERRMRLEAEAEDQRRRHQQAERDRAQEQARQRAETERLRQEREREERRLADLRAFSTQRDGCRAYDIAACETALRGSHATRQDEVDLRGWRDTAVKLDADMQACQAGAVAACEAALGSPAVREYQRATVQEWRIAASYYYRARAFVSQQVDNVTAGVSEFITAVRSLPTSTHVTGGIAATLALALAGVALRNRPRPVGPTQPDIPVASAPRPSAIRRSTTGLVRRVHSVYRRVSRRLRRTWIGFLAARRRQPPLPVPAQAVRLQEPALPAVIPVAQRDTPAALAAMELAYAYIDEVRVGDIPAFDDQATRKQHLNTLSLASKQLDAAQKFDPDAILEGQDDNEQPYSFSVNELKARALLIEGMTHQVYDTRRAIPALVAATRADPTFAQAFYALGLTHAENMNKGHAIEAFQRAVALDPKNLTYRKELNRVENVTGAEIAGYRVTRAGEKIFDAGIKTANAGIRVWNVGIFIWNIFIVAWNIVTFPIRFMHGIFRFLGLPGHR